MDKSHDSDTVLIGHPFAPIGMGEHVRSAYRAFKAAGASAGIYDIYKLAPRTDADYVRNFESALSSRISDKINIFCINGDEIKQAIAHINDVRFQSAYNIIYPMWELSRYPKEWAEQLSRFDEVWSPSEFVTDAIAKEVEIPVTTIPLAVDVSTSRFYSRRHFGIPEAAFSILFFFDFSSYMSRKNPFACIDAFLGLCKRHPDGAQHLVLKYKGGASKDQLAPIFDRLEPVRDRVTVLDGELSDAEVKSLVRNSDVFLSMHRSEGFGRGLAEAMAFGNAAVGTGYSGNLEFMPEEAAFLVDYSLIPVGEDEYPHAEDQCWADADVGHAVDILDKLVGDPELGRTVGRRAKRHLATYFSPRAIGLRYRARIEEICAERTRNG